MELPGLKGDRVTRTHHEPSPPTIPGQEVSTSASRLTGVKVVASKRRHAAAASRIIAVGVSTSAMLGIVAALAANPPSWAKPATPAGASTPADGGVPSTPATTIVVAPVETIRQTVYVDENGNPIDPAQLGPGGAYQLATTTTCPGGTC
ncbi:MAG: hypothetical protein AB7N61_08240 [Acidimicrobiia bacterium]